MTPSSPAGGQADALAVRLPVLAIVGPTASGKSAIAVWVADRLGAEIVAIDSMTIYRGMDVGTAKPSAEQRARVPHHLLDIADPAEPYTVARFQLAARAAIAGIHARRKIPLLTGGSGLYFRAVVDDLDFPPTDALVRARLEDQPEEELRGRLRTADPDAEARIDSGNVRRVVRALEVVELTGSPFSAFRESWDTYESRYDLRVAGLRLTTDQLTTGIAARTVKMMGSGLVDEVRALLDQGLRDPLTASRAIGYREIVAHVEGRITLEEAARLIRQATRRYARRQMTWFGKDPRVVWIDASDPVGAAERILALFSMSGRPGIEPGD